MPLKKTATRFASFDEKPAREQRSLTAGERPEPRFDQKKSRVNRCYTTTPFPLNSRPRQNCNENQWFFIKKS
ncbi:MAG TPA: hypothetical protein DD473_02255 [Planctomycetaceae bacterium]|nr:hypothetical protein [Planctomycetaceae bacterium]